MFRPYLFLLLFVECHIGVFYMSSIDVCAWKKKSCFARWCHSFQR